MTSQPDFKTLFFPTSRPLPPVFSAQETAHEDSWTDAAAKAGAQVGEAAAQAAQIGQFAITAAFSVGEFLGRSAVQAGENAIETASQWSESTNRQLYQFLEQSASGVGQAVTTVADLPLVRNVSGFLRLNWLLHGDDIDVAKVENEVRKLQQQYPTESPEEISHRIMVQKAMLAGGMGFASSLLPGVAAALFAVDLAATTALQTEMIYQIAAAYGLDLRDPARRGEVLGIFGLALGGTNVAKAGFGIFRNLPLAGPVIGASTNATVLYALGYAACRFYDVKRQAPDETPSPEILRDIQQESQQYWSAAQSQQDLMDQALVHMVRASYPNQNREQILDQLQTLQLNAGSLATVALHLESPQPLGSLLEKLDRDFAVPLLSRCYRIAEADGEISPEEAKILGAIADRFDLDLDTVKSTIDLDESL